MRRERGWYTPDLVEEPEVVEALVAEAEQGYDRLSSQFVSRPPDEEMEALRRIAFRVPEDVWWAAQKRADEEQRALSELAAAALREYLARARAARKSVSSRARAARKSSAPRGARKSSGPPAVRKSSGSS